MNLFAVSRSIFSLNTCLQNVKSNLCSVTGNHHHHHISVMELGHLLTRSGLTYPEVSSNYEIQ